MRLLLSISLLLAAFCCIQGQVFVRVLEGEIVSDGGWTFGHSWGDYNGDGCPDLIANNILSGQANLFYRNNCDGTFTRVNTAGLSEPGPSTSSAWGDYNNDGHEDLFIANGGTGGSATNYLFRNEGTGTFTRIMEGILVTQLSSHTVCAWVDLDGDNDLDLFLGRSGAGNQVYWNAGTDEFSSRLSLPDGGGTWGVSFADYDLDGDLDLFCANWGISNYLYANNGDGTLTRVFGSPVVTGSANSVGGSWGDYDNDGDMDLFVSNSGAQDRLFRNDGGTFTEISDVPMVAEVANSEGSSWVDYDNDGDLDLLVSGGGNVSTGYNKIFANDGAANFSEIEAKEFVTLQGRYEGLSVCDYDNDGDMDVFISNHFDNDNLLFSNSGNGNGWIQIYCNGSISNRSGIGARVSLKAVISGVPLWQHREVGAHTGHVSQNPRRLHIGLGDATLIDSLVIHWPSGAEESYSALAPNIVLTLTEGDGPNAIGGDPPPLPFKVHHFTNYPNPFNPMTHLEFKLGEGARVALMIYDMTGSEVAVLTDGNLSAGTHCLQWNGKNHSGEWAASGVYIARLTADGSSLTRKMLLLR